MAGPLLARPTSRPSPRTARKGLAMDGFFTYNDHCLLLLKQFPKRDPGEAKVPGSPFGRRPKCSIYSLHMLREFCASAGIPFDVLTRAFRHALRGPAGDR